MNVHAPEFGAGFGADPDGETARAALNVLKRWAETASAEEIAELDPSVTALVQNAQAYPALSRDYPSEFVVDKAYIASLPDLQNGPESLIKGARRAIQHVGISNFRLPLRFRTPGGEITLETAVTGSVSLDADNKGIFLARFMRSFYVLAD
mgnify:CR=1 FL=1